MARLESILGKVTGTVGNLTFRHQSGTRSVMSSKATQVTNPKSIAQCQQRMKIRPAALFYNAFESVLNHSREGMKIGADHRRAFMAEVMKKTFQGVPHVVKGTNVMVPGLFPISKGNLIGADPYDFTQASFKIDLATSNLTDATVGGLSQLLITNNPSKLQNGDEITVICAVADHNGEFFYPIIDYFVLDTSSTEAMPLFFEVADGGLNYDGTLADENDVIAGAAVVISRKVGEKWKYSTADMFLAHEWIIDLFSEERYKAAIASYGAEGVNAINSPFILQQAGNQPFNGHIAVFNAAVEVPGGGGGTITSVAEYLAAVNAPVTNDISANAIIAVFVSGTQIVNASGKPLSIDNTPITPAMIGWTGTTIQWKTEYLSQVEYR